MVNIPPANARETGLNPGSGRSPGRGNGNFFQFSCLDNPMNRGVWWAAAELEGSKEMDTTEPLSMHT